MPVNIAHLMSTQSVKLIENAAQYIFVEMIETMIQSTKCEYLPFLACSRHTKKRCYFINDNKTKRIIPYLYMWLEGV